MSLLNRKRNRLHFILNDELDSLSRGLVRIDDLDVDDLDFVFKFDRRDGVLSRFKKLL